MDVSLANLLGSFLTQGKRILGLDVSIVASLGSAVARAGSWLATVGSLRDWTLGFTNVAL